MTAITRAQREALKRIYDRVVQDAQPTRTPPPYRQFRRTAVPSFDCLMVPYAGMWLGIEHDGYTHS